MGDGNVANGIVGEWWDKVIHADGDQVALSVSELADLSGRIDAALRAAKVEALREMKTALTSQSGTSAWDVVSYIEARIVDHIAKLDARAAQIEEGE